MRRVTNTNFLFSINLSKPYPRTSFNEIFSLRYLLNAKPHFICLEGNEVNDLTPNALFMSLLLVHTSDFSRNIIHTYRYLFSKKIAKDRRGSWLHFMFLILSWSQWVVAWIFDTWEFDLQPGFCLSPRRIKNRVINSAWQNNREEKQRVEFWKSCDTLQ